MNDQDRDADKEFRDPALTINKVYTRTGDGGRTRLAGGQSVDKDAGRIETYGTIDELNAYVGQARHSAREAAVEEGGSDEGDDFGFGEFERTLLKIQHQLFNLGTMFATCEEDMNESTPRVRPQDVVGLEQEMDRLNQDLPTLRSFVLPGGSRLNTDLHICRTVCRRAERLAVTAAKEVDVDDVAIAYLNRLSDAFFVYSRWVLARAEIPEVLWDPNAVDA